MSVARSGVAVALVIAVLGLSLSDVRAATLVSTDTLTDPQAFATEPPWLAIFHCFQSDSPTTCFQKRAVRALEDMFTQEVDDDETEKSSELEEKLPKGMSPAVGRIIDKIGDLISSGLSQWYPDSDSEDVESAKSANEIEQARGHKKKKKIIHKAIKKFVIKLLIFLYVKQQAIKLYLYGVQTFVFFKMMLIAGVYVLTFVLKTWTLITWHHHEKHSPKVLYIEPKIKHVTQHHAHVAPASEVVHHHHQDYNHEGYEYEPTDQDSIWPRSDSDNDAHRLAYYNQIPSNAATNTYHP